jgi:hypothetical protein
MKQIVRIAAMSLFLFTTAAVYAESWTGWITDASCGAKGAKAEHKSCALRCAERGDTLAFYNTADEKLYKLDDQKTAKEHLGHEVKVEGTLDGDTIKVTAISESKKAE